MAARPGDDGPLPPAHDVAHDGQLVGAGGEVVRKAQDASAPGRLLAMF